MRMNMIGIVSVVYVGKMAITEIHVLQKINLILSSLIVNNGFIVYHMCINYLTQSSIIIKCTVHI